MAEKHLSNDEFFTKLAALFESSHGRNHGSIHLVQKRLTYGQDTTSHSAESDVSAATRLFPDLATPAAPLPVLIRATDGVSTTTQRKTKRARTKLSTVVAGDALEAFFARYADVCKAGMNAGLKKRDRSRRKQKEKERKRKKDAGATEAK